MGTDTKAQHTLYRLVDGCWTEITQGIVYRIARETEDFVLMCLAEHGVGKEYLETHPSEFSVNVEWLENGEVRTYLWNGKPLFSTKETTDIGYEDGKYFGRHTIVRL